MKKLWKVFLIMGSFLALLISAVGNIE
ncbi:MAG: hypothetical protein PWQ72_1463, partial [Pseudothermotoga sp.]|nr:hypothetical protein [Pseudothermotoga sp.]